MEECFICYSGFNLILEVDLIDKQVAQAIRQAAILLDCMLSVEEKKIYQLVESVSARDIYVWSDDSFVAMYQKLFVTQAALCELYFDYEREAKKSLIFTPISVYVRFHESVKESKTFSSQSELGEYYLPNFEFYLDENNFLSVTARQVKTLLEKFWTRYESYMSRAPALQILGLDNSAEWSQIQQRYREQVAFHHPDKGGSTERFIEIRRAYESLKRLQ